MAWKKEWRLLKLAVENGFEIFITVDKNLKYQLNTRKFPIGILVLDIFRTKIEFIKPLTSKVLKAISAIKPHEILEIKETSG